jgi:hypothetical protein
MSRHLSTAALAARAQGGKARLAKYGVQGMRDMAAKAGEARVKHAEEQGAINVANGLLDSIRTPENTRKGAIAANHLRWHTARGVSNPARCKLCLEELRNATKKTAEVLSAESGTTSAVN